MKMDEEVKRSERDGGLAWRVVVESKECGRNGLFKMKGKFDFAQRRKEMEG